jgi:hypothetical protein
MDQLQRSGWASWSSDRMNINRERMDRSAHEEHRQVARPDGGAPRRETSLRPGLPQREGRRPRESPASMASSSADPHRPGLAYKRAPERAGAHDPITPPPHLIPLCEQLPLDGSELRIHGISLVGYHLRGWRNETAGKETVRRAGRTR